MRIAAACALCSIALASCRATPTASDRRSLDQGYILGTADAVKSLYWAKQALESPRAAGPAGRTEYYIWEESGRAADGRKLAPEKVSVPVFIPAPAPAGPP